MPRPQKPADNRTFREKTLPKIKHAPKVPDAHKLPVKKKESARLIQRRLESLENQLEGTANKRQRQRIKESIAAAKRAQQGVAKDSERIQDREELATRPEYLAAKELAQQTLDLIQGDERFHAGYLEAAKRNLQQLRHSLNVEEFAAKQAELCAEYQAERQTLLNDFETRRQAIGASIPLFLPPEPPSEIESRPNPGGKKSLFD